MRIERLDPEWPSYRLATKLETVHQLTPEEVEDALLFSRHELRVRRGRDGAYEGYARTSDGRYLFIPFVVRENGDIWPLTAYDMTEAHKRFYSGGRRRR